MFKQIVHKLRPSLCLKNAKWERGELRCPCGEILALRYMFDGTMKVFIYPEFRKYQQEISKCQYKESEGEVIGTVCFDDFSAFMAEMKITPLNTYVSDEEIDQMTTEEDTYFG